MEFLTQPEKQRLEAQLSEAISKRKALSERIGVARELGDLSENAEYHAAREDQGLNEARIRHLEERLANSGVVDSESVPEDVVFIGTTVKLRDLASEQEECYRLVGETSDEFNDDFVEVTQNSPMGQALMRARVGEVVRVSLPRGDRRFEIVQIV
jgi:transcription elongation factor GreA